MVGLIQFTVILLVETLVTDKLVTVLGTNTISKSVIVNIPLKFKTVCVPLTEGRSLCEYTLILYVLNGKLFIRISVTVVDNTFLLPVKSIYTMTYPLACDDIVQLTLILVSFIIYTLTLLSGGPLGADK